MKNQLSAIAAFFLSSVAAGAEGAPTPLIQHLDAGLLCAAEPVGATPAPDTIAGETHIIGQEPDFVRLSQRVPATLGIGFGIKSQALGAEGIGNVDMVLTHPPMGQDQVTTQRFTTSISGIDPSLTFYQFDYAYELVLGTWTFTAMSGDDVIYTVNFEVVDPRQVPELSGLCVGLDLLS
jgi:hypothetical protein